MDYRPGRARNASRRRRLLKGVIFFAITLWPAVFFVWFVLGFQESDQDAVDSLNSIITVIGSGSSP